MCVCALECLFKLSICVYAQNVLHLYVCVGMRSYDLLCRRMAEELDTVVVSVE